MHIFRRHQKLLLWAMFLLIGIPMLFFGVPAFWNSGRDDPGSQVVASVGNVPFTEADLINALSDAAEQQAAGGERPSYAELEQNGTVKQVMFDFLDRALLRIQAGQRDFTVDESLLIEHLKESPTFRDKEGNFNKEMWNAWIRAQNENSANWKGIYQELNDQLAHQVFTDVMLAPAVRVLDSDIDKELAARYTKLQVKYAKIEPPVTPTEEQIKAQYEDNKDTYREKDKRMAEFVSISLEAEPTEEVLDLVKRAQAGEDFAALANEQAGDENGNGGDMGWINAPTAPGNVNAPLFDLAPGEVSGAVRAPGGFNIFKNEEERMQAPEGGEAPEALAEPVRQIHGRKIFIPVALTEEEREARTTQAGAIFDTAKENGGDLAAAAQAQGLSVEKTGWFDANSFEIEGLPQADARRVAIALNTVAKGEVGDLISASTAMYVAKVVDLQEGQVPPLEDVREQVEQDAIAALKRAPEYQERVQEEAGKILAGAKTLEEAKTKFPDLNLDIQETAEFSVKDSPYISPIFLQSAQVFQAFIDKEPGDLAGPIASLLRDSFVLELVKRVEPTDEDKANWADERKSLRENMLRMAQNEFFQDYRLNLRNTAGIPIKVNEAAKARILGTDQAPEPEAPEADAPVADTPASE